MLLIGVGAAAFALSSAPAHAQDRPLTLFDLLFGRRQRYEPQPEPGARQMRRSRPRASTRSRPEASAPASSAETAPPPVAKLDNARKILVVGDFSAGALADGLAQAFANAPGVVVDDRSNGSSGLVRSDYYDWTGKLPSLLQQDKPAVVAVMIGSNDRQTLDVDGAKQSVRSPAWIQEYTRRVQAFADTIHRAGYPFIWLGQPSYQWSSMTADMIAFNDIYRAATEKAGGTFVEIWGGFVDDSGNFTESGADINGQPAQLRTSDGINFSKDGRRKIAFYAEKPLRQILGEAAAPGVSSLSPGSGNAFPPGGGASDRLAPMAIDDPAFDGGTRLLGGAEAQAAAKPEKSLRDELVRKGVPPPGRTGRADDFSWPSATSP
jgi:hypothetical protein